MYIPLTRLAETIFDESNTAGRRVHFGNDAAVAAKTASQLANEKSQAAGTPQHTGVALDHAEKAVGVNNPQEAAEHHRDAMRSHRDAMDVHDEQMRKAGFNADNEHEEAFRANQDAHTAHYVAVYGNKNLPPTPGTGNPKGNKNLSVGFSKDFDSLPESAKKAAFAHMARSEGHSGKAGRASQHAQRTGSKSAHAHAARLHREAAAHHREHGNERRSQEHASAARYHARRS